MNGCDLCRSGRQTCELCFAIKRETLFATCMWGGIGVVCLAAVVFIGGVLVGWW